MNIQILKSAPKGAVSIRLEERDDERVIENESGISIGYRQQSVRDQRGWMRTVRRLVREAQSRNLRSIAVDFEPLRMGAMKDASDITLCGEFAVSAVVGAYEFRTYRSVPKGGWPIVEQITLLGEADAAARRALEGGLAVGEEVNAARDLANAPAGDMTPSELADAAKRAVRKLKVGVKVLGRKEMEKLKMGALLGVAKGSSEEPKLIIMEYKGGKSSEKPIALVGKGITFDTGGINLKPSAGGSLEEMHMDMSGGAAVIHAVAALARLGVKKNVVGIVAAAENMVSGSSYRPGDILRAMSGKTIEVLNTDAEGRLVLADALTYVQKEHAPRLIIDVATLTGAAWVALGTYASAVLSHDTALSEKIRNLGMRSGDYAWPLPLLPEFVWNLKSKRADIANIATSNPRFGGTMNGAAFLSAFVEEGVAWAHIDMVPRMTATAADQMADGSTGEPVRLLLECAASL